jgi:hypothetical protein
MDWKSSRVVRIAVGALLYGVLMTFRETLTPAWARIAVAAVAGCVLGLLLVSGRPRQ